MIILVSCFTLGLCLTLGVCILGYNSCGCLFGQGFLGLRVLFGFREFAVLVLIVGLNSCVWVVL